MTGLQAISRMAQAADKASRRFCLVPGGPGLLELMQVHVKAMNERIAARKKAKCLKSSSL